MDCYPLLQAAFSKITWHRRVPNTVYPPSWGSPVAQTTDSCRLPCGVHYPETANAAGNIRVIVYLHSALDRPGRQRRVCLMLQLQSDNACPAQRWLQISGTGSLKPEVCDIAGLQQSPHDFHDCWPQYNHKKGRKNKENERKE